MTQRANSTSMFLGTKLIPTLLLAYWLGINVLGATQVQAQVDPIDSSIPVVLPVPETTEPPLEAEPASPVEPAAEDSSSAYIDETDYSIGATQLEAPTTAGYSEPSEVVLSERTTGHETTLQAGQSVPENLYSSETAAGPSGWTTSDDAQTGSLPDSGVTATASSTGAGADFSSTADAPVNIGPLALSNRGIQIGSLGKLKNFIPKARLNGNTLLTFPLAIPAAITSAFGWRIHPITGEQRFHSGTDLGAPMGTPVLAAYAGKVAIAEFQGGYGLSVVLEHHQGQRQTRYAHLSEILVQPGTSVKQGSIIGRVGSTGNSTGPHLHFELSQATPAGWVVTDPGEQLEYALAHLVRVLQSAQVKPQPGT